MQHSIATLDTICILLVDIGVAPMVYSLSNGAQGQAPAGYPIGMRLIGSRPNAPDSKTREVRVRFLVDLLKSLLKERSVQVAIGGAVVNGLLYLWAYLAALPGFPAWVPDPSPLFFEVGKWVELLLAGWAASAVRQLYFYMRVTCPPYSR